MELEDIKKEVLVIRNESEDQHVPANVRQESFHRLSSVYKNGLPHKGDFTKEEEDQFLRLVLDVEPGDKEWRSEVNKFWEGMTIKVDTNGAVLNASVQDGRPVNPLQYIQYRWATTHPHVASSEEEMNRFGKFRFYIKDPEAITKAQNAKVKVKTQARKEFAKVVDDIDTVKRIIRVMDNVNPSSLTEEQAQNKLDSLMTSDPARFYEVATDKTLEQKDFIADLVTNSILRKSGNSYFYIDEKVGNTVDEVVDYIKDKANSGTILDWKEKLKAAKK